MLSIKITIRALNFISHIFPLPHFHYVCSLNHVNGFKLPKKKHQNAKEEMKMIVI